MTGFDEDRELDDFLARRSMLHRRLAERDRADPSPELDRLVLAKAREAIDTPTNNAVYRAPRWALPVALAATVVLAFALVLNMGRVQHSGYPVAASASPSADRAAIAETGEVDAAWRDTQGFAAEPELAKKRAVDALTSAPAAAPPAFAMESRPQPPGSPLADASRDAVGAASGGLLASTVEPLSRARATREQSRASDVALAKARTIAPAVAMPREVAKVSSASEASRVLTASNAPASPIAESTAGARAEYAQAPADTRAIVPAKSEMTVSNTATAANEVMVTGSRRASKEQGTPLVVTQSLDEAEVTSAAAAAAAPAPAPPPVPLTAEAKRANPQAWLREIAALRTAGKTTEADRELAEFRKAFPNEPIKLPSRDPRPVQ